MSSSTSELLEKFWYVLCPAQSISKNKLQSFLFLNQRIVVFRNSENQVQALKDFCPHRGIPLSFGRLLQNTENGTTVECSYHGWQFGGSGECVHIPSLTSEQKLDCRKIKIKTFSVREEWGLIWISDVGAGESAPYFPDYVDLISGQKPVWLTSRIFPCHIDHAVIGLMDPAHGPFVHQSKFWRSAKSIHDKQKRFGPIPFGFQMLRHQPSKNSKAYKVLGGNPTTEISFQLPALRTESIHAGKLKVFSFTALLPIDEKSTQVWQFVYWNKPWLFFLKPLLHWFGNRFLDQDLDAVKKQQLGLKDQPPLMLINDSDTQAKWYYRLKGEWQESQLQKREFQNPVRETVLQWRS